MRVINFNPGPAGLPLPALEKARDELLDFEGSGMSIMEHSHRGKVFERVLAETQALFAELLNLPSTHQVLFLTGGASTQFALVPMNFLPADKTADYVITGGWSEKAFDEAKLLGAPRVAATTKNADGRFTRVPAQSELKLAAAAAYVHTTSNNTLFGTQFHHAIDTGSVPHICDMSSDFMWKPVDVSKYAFIYAGAQKNLGPSGVVVAVADKALLAKGRTDIPKVFRYAVSAENDSMYNTPPTLAIYLVRNVLQWMKAQGGLPAMEQRNLKKAELLYGALDAMSGFYSAPVEKASRSTMNIVFKCPSEALDGKLVDEATKAGMVGLKGHRSTGGLRASLYNAVSIADVEALVGFLKVFAATHG